MKYTAKDAIQFIQAFDAELVALKAEVKCMRAKADRLLFAIEESRAATQLFANDGMPDTLARYELSERAIKKAIKEFKGDK